MKILTVDIGTGTQDIFLYDSRLALENGFKLVLGLQRFAVDTANTVEVLLRSGQRIQSWPIAAVPCDRSDAVRTET